MHHSETTLVLGKSFLSFHTHRHESATWPLFHLRHFRFSTTKISFCRRHSRRTLVRSISFPRISQTRSESNDDWKIGSGCLHGERRRRKLSRERFLDSRNSPFKYITSQKFGYTVYVYLICKVHRKGDA